MNTIQTGMLIALGFLAAALLGLLVAPALWARAVRLTTRRITQTVPLTAMEIEADRDRVRAEYAIKMHKLEALVEQVKLSGARQQIEINRRDARVNVLATELEQLKAAYEEAQNARRVLEQTIADRLPRVEGRLSEAKKLLFTRERDIGDLTITTRRQFQALSEAQRNSQEQLAEIDQIAKLLAERVQGDEVKLRDRDAALRKALDGVKSKIRAGLDLLSRAQPAGGAAPVGIERPGDVPPAGRVAPVASAGPGAGSDDDKKALERQIRQLRGRTDQQAAEIARLKAELAASNEPPARHAAGQESRQVLAARVAELEAERAAQAATVEALRDELMELNERAQLSGANSSEASGIPPVGAGGRLTLAERVAQARSSEIQPVVAEPVQAEAPPSQSSSEDVRLANEDPGGTAPSDSLQPQPAQRPRMRLADRIASLSRSSG